MRRPSVLGTMIGLRGIVAVHGGAERGACGDNNILIIWMKCVIGYALKR